MTDEIICSACGRPNLPEAVKCWYCQEILERQAHPSEDGMPPISATDQDDAVKRADGYELGADTPEAVIPDWLKRIRALKEADQKKEEERSRWQQNVLFSSSVSKEPKEAANVRREPRKRRPPHVQQTAPQTPVDEKAVITNPAEQQQPDLPAQENNPTQVELNSEDDMPDASEKGSLEDLPDGFVPFERE